MKQINTKPNLFVVHTPHQLLNAVEAVHSLRLRNNHLLVTGPKRGRFMPLIKEGDWATVSFPSLWIEPRYRVQRLLGPALNLWYCACLHLLEMYAMARITRRFQDVDQLFLGHYRVEWAPFMRHIANAIKYNTLYLLDDGTDTIEINKRRHRIENNQCEAPIDENAFQSSVRRKIETHLRVKYWNWHLEEAHYVTFFTIYDLDIRKGDQLIRNNYRHLQSLAPLQRIYMPDTVLFLGICSGDDYIDMNAYLDFLSNVRDFFVGKKIIYVAHPRDNASRLNRIREHLEWELWPSSSVIENDLIVQGVKPKAVAGFASSALVTLAHLMDRDVEIVCFHIPPKHWIHWREDAVEAYNYMKSKVPRVSVVPIGRPGSDSRDLEAVRGIT